MCHIAVVSRSAAFHVILFDLDGTLTDSAPGILNCIRYALDDMGIEYPDDDAMRRHLGPPLSETFGVHFGMSEADIARAIAKYRERFHDVGMFENAVYDGIPELLDGLAAAGAVLAVSTSKPTPSATRILEHYGLAHRFAFIGGAELHGSRQHKADVIEHTLDELGALGRYAPHDTAVMIGDREHDMRGAAAHSMPGIGVLWGYGGEDELLRAGAILVVASPSQLLSALLQRTDDT